MQITWVESRAGGARDGVLGVLTDSQRTCFALRRGRLLAATARQSPLARRKQNRTDHAHEYRRLRTNHHHGEQIRAVLS